MMSLKILVLTLFAAPVHSVTDISQLFTFYLDGRFARQYLDGRAEDRRNWGSLAELDLTNVNLLVLSQGDPRIPYTAEAQRVIREFLKAGGTVLVMADGAAVPPPVARVLKPYGVSLSTTPLVRPLRGERELQSVDIVGRAGSTLELSPEWTTLIQDTAGQPVLAERRVGVGTLVVGSRGLFGQKPDASDPINDRWVGDLLVSRAIRRPIDPTQPHRRTWAEDHRRAGPLKIEFHDGTARFADGIVEVYHRVRPHLRDIMGVDPSPGMIQRMLILPTGGGGFSSGVCIAIGAWWGGFPDREYPMVELIAHEAGHSWVLPHPEPLWNEPIATWLGIEVGRRLGMAEATATLERQLRRGRLHDADFTQIDPGGDQVSRDLLWGKSFFVFEELERKYGPNAMAKYFTLKRKLAPSDREGYTLDDCVAVWSQAVGEDLFPWFRSLAFDVHAERTDLMSP